MGLSDSPEIFQEKINKILCGSEFIQVYINNLLIITNGDWYDHLEKLELTPQNIKDNGLKCNIKNSFFGKTDMEYLGFWVTWKGIQRINDKLEAIVKMTPPNNTKEVRALIGVVNYYRGVWARQSHLLHPLTALT